MKRLALCLPWMVSAMLAYAGHDAPAHVNFTYRGLGQGEAFRIDDACFVEPDMLRAWGWQVDPEPNEQFAITVDGQKIEVAGRMVHGLAMPNLTNAVRMLDGDAHWRRNTDLLDVTGRIRVVRFTDKHITVSTSLAVQPQVSFLQGPSRVAFDFNGASLSPDAIVDVTPGLEIVSLEPGQVRISAPIARPFSVDATSRTPGREFDLDTDPQIAAAQTGPTSSTVSLKLELETESALKISMPLPTALRSRPNLAFPDPSTLRVWLPGVQVQLSTDTPLSSPSVKSVTADAGNAGTLLTLILARPMGVSISTDGTLEIRLFKPPVGDGRLAGKLIVVDAGHGGHDSGTKSLDDPSLMEKDLTLSVSKLLAEDLASEGARVIMTRRTDVFIPLPERSAISNRAHANLFLCVHINSNGADRRTSGSITFFHNQDPISSTLANCIEHELPVSGIPGIGTWSDTKIYHSGFAVLRGIKMPGVLMELGFINNEHDRALLIQADVQSRIASAIVRGVRTYLGEDTNHEK